ncbi:MAG: ATP-binding protein [Polyangiales bacterium]
MTDDAPLAHEQRFLVLAPTGRDAPLTVALLRDAGVDAHACGDVDDLCVCIESEGAAGLMIAEEVLVPGAIRCLEALLQRQPSWSDLPILVFTGMSASARARPSGERVIATLGNVTLLDRPLRPITMLSAAHSALRARHRQYAARDELREQRRAVYLRDQFLAMLGHELRNPLSAIMMALELEGDGNARAHREVMRRQAKHLARLVDDLLDVSRVTSGKIVLRRESLDLTGLVARCVDALTALAASHEQTLTLRTHGEPVMVDADPVRIEQVLVNLITNASKYTPAGGNIVVELSASETEAQLAVRDDGVGISADMLPHVFDLFTQVESSLARAKGGMGIGLTLVRSLVGLHGGTVEAESDGVDRGSTFVVRLPRVAMQRSAAPSEAVAQAAQKPQGMRILVVEDNDDSRTLLAMLLSRRGHQVTTAVDGPSGVAEAIAQRPEALLVDIGLPGLDGYGVAREIRRALGDDVTLIALTGYGQPDDRARALAAGFDVHLTKPLNVAQVDALLSRPRPAAQ